MDEWALHSAPLGTAGIGGIHAAGASGKCLFHLDLVSPDPFPPTAYLQPYQATLTVSNRGPESVPALMVDVSSQSSRDLTASLSGVPLTPEPTFPPMLVGGLDVLEPGGAAPLAFRLVPTNATQGASLSVSAFTLASTRGRFISSSVALPFSSDSDGDAMPDLWEVRYGFNPLDPSDAAGDADGDGMSNLDEYRAGTDPRNAASNLRITLVGPVGAPRLAFPVGPRRTWILERTEVLGPRAEWTSFAFGATADTEQAQEVDPGPRVVGFFRVRILGQ
jgi:hypothetical protein